MFLLGFAKRDLANITANQAADFKLAGSRLLIADDDRLEVELASKRLVEISYEKED